MTIPNEKLRRARLEKRWSVTTASQRVGVSTNTFSRWEQGLQIPQLATLNQLMEAFERSAEELGFGFVIAPQAHTHHSSGPVESAWDRALVPATPEPEMDVVQYAASAGYSLQAQKPPHVQPSACARVEEEQLSRRRVIAALIGAPAAAFCIRQGDTLSLLRAEEILSVCASHIPLCWQLYFEGGQLEVERVLPDYIVRLTTLARYPSVYQRRAASLLSQAYQLSSLLGTQRQNYGAALLGARQAFVFGDLAGDLNLQLASCIRQALVCFYMKRPRQRLQAYQQALQLAPRSSPLLQGRTYIGLAEVLSQLGDEHEAWRFLEMAQQVFPVRAEDDPNFAYTHFSLTSLAGLEGLMHLNLKQPDLAWRAFGQAERAMPGGTVPVRLEITVRQAAASCALGELEQTCHCLRTAVPMARDLGSYLRVDESYEVYERMLNTWGDDPRVQEMEGIFR
ncbi:MAG TPA: helix-turn-helix domain-containing protein [Ktedonobacteraceae bacterium]|jgi:transcriptional regulator with XRE-family HTH domain/tetratricopeptide (TPR) repeat protein